MNEDRNKQEAETPVEPIDVVLAQLAALIQSLEDKRDQDAENAQLPADIPRFVTCR